ENACIARDPNATCTDDFGFYNCHCGPFWTGPQCLDDVNECALVPTPCKLFSTCNNTIGDYQCLCINGTEGKDCDYNPNDCLINNVTACNSVDEFANCTDGFAEGWIPVVRVHGAVLRSGDHYLQHPAVVGRRHVE
ncbi:hypothetical protein PENTCL1PPCAC_16545, partial [Pristionchus entomophagus]